VTSSRLPRCPSATISVQPDSATRADFMCDTGIR
jgi:hypothetical protein